MHGYRVPMSVLIVSLLAATSAHAVWNETIAVVGPDPDLIQGAEVSFAVAGGDVVPGTVDQDDRGKPVLRFVLPGRRPTRGSVVVVFADGTQEAFGVPARDPGTALELNLETRRITPSGTATGSMTRDTSHGNRFAVGVGVFAAHFQSDHLSATAAGSATELADVFAQSGVTDASAGSRADDDGRTLGVSLSAQLRVSDRGSIYLRSEYGEVEEFEGLSFGSGSLGPASVEASAPIESDVEFVSLAAGYEHALSPRWSFYGGAGYVWADEDLSFSSIITVDGVPVSETQGSESNSEGAWLFEGGVRFHFGRVGARSRPFSVDIGAKHTGEIFNDERVTVFAVRPRYLFNF